MSRQEGHYWIVAHARAEPIVAFFAEIPKVGGRWFLPGDEQLRSDTEIISVESDLLSPPQGRVRA